MAEDNSKCTSLSQSFSLDLILKTKVSELVEMAIYNWWYNLSIRKCSFYQDSGYR